MENPLQSTNLKKESIFIIIIIFISVVKWFGPVYPTTYVVSNPNSGVSRRVGAVGEGQAPKFVVITLFSL